MFREIRAIHLEVEPVEDEALDEPQNSLAEECIDAVFNGLEENCDHSVTEDQGDECIGTLGAMLNVDRCDRVSIYKN